ncbi:MAG: hypothetical protein R3185_05880, partial [Candidatus Thermoplasmatota archaeon]|nr:hypothetical protein [Candidatus Thermoplasmatota archaeon]
MGAQADFLGGEVTAVNEKAGFMVVKTSDARTLKALARLDDRVRYIAEDRPDAVKALAAPNDPAYYKQWGLKASPGTDAETAWETVPGSTSTIVAVVDS